MMETEHGSVPESEKQIERKDLSFDEWLRTLKPSDLAMVHVTNTFPRNNKIRSHVGWSLETGDMPTMARDTVHFTLNDAVPSKVGTAGIGGEWHERDFAIISPLEAVKKEQIANLWPADTFVDGDFEIPTGSKLLIDWRSLSKLRDEKVISNEVMQNLLTELGMEDNYMQSNTVPVKKAAFEKNGVEYIVCDLQGNNFRSSIREELDSMDIRVEPVEGWDLPNDFREKNSYPKGGLHDNSEARANEQVDNYVLKLKSLYAHQLLSYVQTTNLEIYQGLEDGEKENYRKDFEGFIEDLKEETDHLERTISKLDPKNRATDIKRKRLESIKIDIFLLLDGYRNKSEDRIPKFFVDSLGTAVERIGEVVDTKNVEQNFDIDEFEKEFVSIIKYRLDEIYKRIQNRLKKEWTNEQPFIHLLSDIEIYSSVVYSGRISATNRERLQKLFRSSQEDVELFVSMRKDSLTEGENKKLGEAIKMLKYASGE